MLGTIHVVFPDMIRHTLICVHWKSFPPPGAGKGPSDEVRKRGEVTQDEYSRLQIWERICGETRMNRRVCPQCPHMRFLEEHDQNHYIVTPTTGFRTPVIDLPTLENWSRRKVVQGRPQPTKQPAKVSPNG